MVADKDEGSLVRVFKLQLKVRVVYSRCIEVDDVNDRRVHKHLNLYSRLVLKAEHHDHEDDPSQLEDNCIADGVD